MVLSNIDVKCQVNNVCFKTRYIINIIFRYLDTLYIIAIYLIWYCSHQVYSSQYYLRNVTQGFNNVSVEATSSIYAASSRDANDASIGMYP